MGGTLDREFHDALLTCAGNKAIRALGDSLARPLAFGSRDSQASPHHVRAREARVLALAREIVSALEARDLAAAEDAMRAAFRVGALMAGPPVYLFVADHEIASMRDLRRRIGQAAKHPDNPLVTPDSPWEGDGIFPSATVLAYA